MSGEIPDGLLARLSDSVATRFGLDFPQERWPDLARRSRAFLQDHGQEEAVCNLERLFLPGTPPGESEAFAHYLTVGETYFFRENHGLEILTEQIVPSLTLPNKAGARDPGKRHIRIWSAGCATGEEPYSIAMALHEKMPELSSGRVAIFATDLNTRFLRAASDGVYSEWSFRGVSQSVKSKYFSATADGRWAIAPQLKCSVTFGYFNLAADGYPPWFGSTNLVDVVFCRNVLMYFTPDAANKAIDIFHRSLTDGGWLIVSPVETSQELFSKFETVRFPDAVLYRKTGGRSVELRSPHCVAPPAVIADTVPPAAPEAPEISYAAASSLYQQGHYEDAAAMLRALVSSEPGNAQAALLLARIFADQGSLGEASRWCEKAIEIDKVDAWAYYLWAAILEEQGSLERAAVLLRKSLYLNPKLVLGHFALGNLALRQGKLQESAKHFENTLAILATYGEEEVLPQSGGLTAGRLRELVAAGRLRERSDV